MSTTYPIATAIPAGWFSDPENETRLRWWDGEVWTADVAAYPAAAETRSRVRAVEPVAAPVIARIAPTVALTRRQLRLQNGPLVSGPLNEPEAVQPESVQFVPVEAAAAVRVPAKAAPIQASRAQPTAEEPWLGAPAPMIPAGDAIPFTSDYSHVVRQSAHEAVVPAPVVTLPVVPFLVPPLETTEAVVTNDIASEPDAKTPVVSSLTMAVALIAILPLAQLVAIVLNADSFITPQGSWMRYVLLGAPAILSLLLAAIDRRELVKAEQVSLPPVGFALLPPLYLVFRAIRVGRKSSVPLLVWLVLQAAAVGGLFVLMPSVFASLTQLGR